MSPVEDTLPLTTSASDALLARFNARYRLLIWCSSSALIVLFIAICSPTAKKIKPVDFIYFYSASEIVNRMPAQDVYDPKIQSAMCERLFPLTDNTAYGRFLYPPYIPLLLAPLAKGCFLTAYRAFQAVSAIFYLSGLLLMLRAFFPSARNLASVALPVALAFSPFLANTWHSGQLSFLGFLGMALALCQLRWGHLFRTGLALSICAYKPTFLLLLIPMLLLNKQWRILAGFVTGASAAFLLGLSAFGWQPWLAYVRLLLWSNGVEQRPFPLYADLSSFFSLLGASHIALQLSMLCGVMIAPFLIAAWRRYKLAPAPVWAMTITWTLLLNTYAPLYDTILIVPSIIASWALFSRMSYRRLLMGLLLLFVFAGLGTCASAFHLHLQIWTLALVALGLLQVNVFLRSRQTASIPITAPMVLDRAAP